MMKYLIILKKALGAALFSIPLATMISCTDVQGDGIETVIWNGSELPEDSLYWNPVWEPDLSFPAVFKASVGYYAIGADNEWSPGIISTTPVISSSDLMRWKLREPAFLEKPDWSEGMITELSAGFAKTKGTYYIFYSLDGEGIGMAGSKSPLGPYTDFGPLINTDSVGLSQCNNPFFYARGSKAWVFFNGGDGMYGQELILSKTELADLKGDPFRVTGGAIQSMNMTKIGDYYYLFAGVHDGNDSRVNLGRSMEIAGPYLDKDGNDLLNGEGTPLLASSLENGFVEVNHVGGILEDANEEFWVAFQATDADQPLLTSGRERHPLMLTKIELDETGWPTQVIEAKGGWNYPKFPK